MPDLGWFEVGEINIDQEQKKKDILLQIDTIIQETNQKVAADNLNITKLERANWIEYRRLLKEIPLQPDYPNNVQWPKRPDVE